MVEHQTAVNSQCEIVLEGLFDYAGLYPPANLDMQPVVENWSNYLQGDDSWMLARLIIPASRLEEFKLASVDLLPSPDDEPWQLSVLLPPADTDKFEPAVQATVEFNLEDCGAVANVVEFKASTTGSIDTALSVLHDDLFPFIELPIIQNNKTEDVTHRIVHGNPSSHPISRSNKSTKL